MFQELEYLRLKYWGSSEDYTEDIRRVIQVYSIDNEMTMLMGLPKLISRYKTIFPAMGHC